jgi:negative regulator of replication initiation
MEARRITSDTLAQLTKAADASNRAVMADQDAASRAFAHEAEEATQVVRGNIDALRSLLTGLDYSQEGQLLTEFDTRFGAYLAMDRVILGMAVERTNLKAQRLSFGPAREAADAFRTSLESIVASSEPNQWHVRALVETAIAALREIQSLQAPHIAEAEDAAMSSMEQQMGASASAARKAMEQLASLLDPQSMPDLAAARSALDRFLSVNTELVALSRRNTNVRSLSMSLGSKRALTMSCEDELRAIQDALTKRSVGGTR